MDFVQAIKSCLGQYATFSGRATRSEFWWFFLFQVLVMAATGMLGDVINGIASLALLLTTECMVADAPKDEAGAGGGMPDMGGMGGMGGMGM